MKMHKSFVIYLDMSHEPPQCKIRINRSRLVTLATEALAEVCIDCEHLDAVIAASSEVRKHVVSSSDASFLCVRLAPAMPYYHSTRAVSRYIHLAIEHSTSVATYLFNGTATCAGLIDVVVLGSTGFTKDLLAATHEILMKLAKQYRLAMIDALIVAATKLNNNLKGDAK